MKHIKGLDTLRAFAVFFVIIAHFGVWFNAGTFSGKMMKGVIIPDGGFGVYLFFVLSGFLITTILLKAKKEETGSRIHIVKNFYIRRALRIFPIYYLTIFLLYAVNYIGIRADIGYYLTYTVNFLLYRINTWNSFSHTWSLCIEEQFYLIWPWVAIWVSDKYFKYVLFAAIIIGVVTCYITTEIQGHFGPLMVYNYFDAFGIGGLYAWVRLEGRHIKRFETIAKIVVVPALGIYLYWKITSTYITNQLWGIFLLRIDYIILSLWLLMLVLNNKSRLIGRYLLENKFLNFIGKISYGIYLYHYAYLHMITICAPQINVFLSKNRSLGILMSYYPFYWWFHVAMIILIASLSYYLIEKPILRLKDRFKYNERIPNRT